MYVYTVNIQYICVCMWISVKFAAVYMYMSVGMYMDIGVGIYTEGCMYIMFFHV